MSFRWSRLTLGGRLSLIYLSVATSFLLLSRGPASEWAFMYLGLPLAYLIWVASEVFYAGGRLPAVVGVSLFAILWVANAYLWGHVAAALVRFARRVTNPIC